MKTKVIRRQAVLPICCNLIVQLCVGILYLLDELMRFRNYLVYRRKEIQRDEDPSGQN